MNIKIKQVGFKKAAARIRLENGKKALKASLKRLVEYGENRIGLNASKFVYSYKPKTKSYKRTGRLLGGRGSSIAGGRPSKKNLNDLAVQLEANPQLKGASFNYAYYVDQGKGWMKRVGPRPFWTTSLKEVKKKAPEILQQAVIKEFK